MPGPSPSAHQVLVYSGPGVSPLSLSHTLLTLSLLLLPHYTVQPVSPATLATEPWEPNTALVVIPGGRDLPFVEELAKGGAVGRIKEYVRLGGRYLGLCAGAYFGAGEVRFDVGGGKEVTGARELAFFPGPCVGPAFPGFDYATENGSRAVSLSTPSGKLIQHVYYNGGGYFPPSTSDAVTVVASYADLPSLPAAAVLCASGSGRALLCAAHFEYPLHDPPARDAIAKLEHVPEQDELERAERERLEWVRELLRALGLKPPRPDDEAEADDEAHLLLHPTHPSPVLVLSHPALTIGENVFDGLKDKLVDGDGEKTLLDANDELHIKPLASLGDAAAVTSHLFQLRRTQPEFPPSAALAELSLDPAQPAPPQPPDFNALPKAFLTPSADAAYDARWTPLFNFETYWAELDATRKRSGRKSGVLRGEHAAIGDLIWYGETVTSTQTMLDRNPLLLTNLPSPLVFLASFQLTGRGRGSNIWLSPPGCLQFSLLLELPQAMASKLVFIQYLTALAVCEAVDDDGALGVRIKWPNDLYAEAHGVGGSDAAAPAGAGAAKGRAKLGGILVNTNFVGGRWRVVVGCGINVLNAAPTTSLGQLHGLLAARLGRDGDGAHGRPLPPAPTMEGTFARIMAAFETKWEQFVDDKGFEGFMDEYYGRWLHANQEVTLTTVDPPQRLRIASITPDHGLLRCVPLAAAASSSLLGSRYDRDDSDDRTSFTRVTKPTPAAPRQEQYVDLQPDGNSFDLMSGMIKRKV
ncbi:biotin holocarboxylase synthetase [Cryptotrichosporon argae]